MSHQNPKPVTQTKVLHVVGSPDSLFHFKLSIFYASHCQEFGKYVFLYVGVHPNGLWSFPESLQDLDTNGLTPLDEAMAKIRCIMPDAIIHHLFCKRGHSEYRRIIQELGFPMLGSTAEVASISQSKSMTRNVVQEKGVRIPEGLVFKKGDGVDDLKNELHFPCVVKPDMAEDSVGVTLVKRSEDLDEALEEAFKHGNVTVVERFIAGREIRVGVIGDWKSNLQVLPALEYLNLKKNEIRSFDKKLKVDDSGLPISKAACSAEPSFMNKEKEPHIIRRLSDSATSAFRALKIQDFACFDFRVDDDGMPWLLEANLFCSFGENSILAIMAKQAGFSCHQLLDQIVENALARHQSKDVVI